MSDPVTVLIVDDSRAYRQMTRTLLRLSGGTTVVGEAVDGQEALELACKLRPQVILLDVMMPNMDGREALVHITRLCPESKVIMLSACMREEVVQEALDNGAWCYLIKGEGDVVRAIRAAAPQE